MQRSSSSLPPLASLRAFEAVSRLSSVKLASEYLNVTPSAISHQLRALEAHLGVQLIQIKGRRIRLTEEGAIYAPAITQVFSDLFRANVLLEGRRDDSLVHVSTTPTFALLAALPHLDSFAKANPKIELRLETRNTNLDFDVDEFDAAVCVGRPPCPGLFAHRLSNSRMVPLAHPKLWEKFAPIKTAGDIARMPLIDFCGTPILWHRWLQDADPTRDTSKDHPYLISDSLLTAIQMAESGMGVILGPSPLIAPKVMAGPLRASPHRFTSIKTGNDFYFVCRTAIEESSKVKAVQKWLISISKKLELEAGRLGI